MKTEGEETREEKVEVLLLFRSPTTPYYFYTELEALS